MPGKRASVKNEKQYEALKKKGMSKERAAKIANSPDASKHGGQKSGSGGQREAGRHHRAEEGRRPQGRQGDRSEAVVEEAVTQISWSAGLPAVACRHRGERRAGR
jgi:hypothetical protein